MLVVPQRRKSDTFWEGKARIIFVVAFAVFGGGGTSVLYKNMQQAEHEATVSRQEMDNLRADRTRYEDLQQHCNERQIDMLRNSK